MHHVAVEHGYLQAKSIRALGSILRFGSRYMQIARIIHTVEVHVHANGRSLSSEPFKLHIDLWECAHPSFPHIALALPIRWFSVVPCFRLSMASPGASLLPEPALPESEARSRRYSRSHKNSCEAFLGSFLEKTPTNDTQNTRVSHGQNSFYEG